MPIRSFQTATPTIKTGDYSPIHSHESYEADVYAICHHSGRYLTRTEANSNIPFFWYEQHDFPGLPKLDRAFIKAIHSKDFQHLIWSETGLQSLTTGISGLLVLIMVNAVYQQRYFVSAGTWYILFNSLLILATLFSLSSISIAIYLALPETREKRFHAKAVNFAPAVPDFPLTCTYEIDTLESLENVTLGNVNVTGNIMQQTCQLDITLHPLNNDTESYREYWQQYQHNGTNRYVHAGVIALANLQNVQFTNNEFLEYDHRFVLKVHESDLQRNSGHFQPFTIHIPYLIDAIPLLQPKQYGEQAQLECQPLLAPFDSRTLELHFYWCGEMGETPPKLESCTLDITSLGKVTHIDRGQYIDQKGCIVWRNLTFQEPRLVLRASFEEAIIKHPEVLTGNYTFTYNGLLSQMHISPDLIWTAIGLKTRPGSSIIRKRTTISGELQIDTKRLSQEHEYVRKEIISDCLTSPDYKTIQSILNVLMSEGVDIQRVIQASPIFGPGGNLNVQLQYWDIIGCRYDHALIDSFDVHVVVSGQTQISKTVEDQHSMSKTQIDIRAHCLHDPRNLTMPHAVDNFFTALDENGRRLRDRLIHAVC